MSSTSTTEAPAATVVFVCNCDAWVRSACEGLEEYEGTGYCVLHYPSKEKITAFNDALNKKFKSEDFNFSGVWFPNAVDFARRTFTAPATFSYASFNATANFDHATFSKRAFFDYAIFSAEALFNSAIFSAKAYFSEVKFGAKAEFNNADFYMGADFLNTIFSGDAYFTDVFFSAEADPTAEKGSSFSASAYFSGATFGAKTDFTFTRFEGADFNKARFNAEAFFSGAAFDAKADISAVAYFTSVMFSEKAYFKDTTFSAEAYFVSAAFNMGADFINTTFNMAANFRDVVFGASVDFSSTIFRERVNFQSANFKDRIIFAGDDNRSVFSGRASLDLQFPRIEKPDLVSFRSLSLRPHWLVNTDPRKFDFNVDWRWSSINEEIQGLKHKGISQPNRLLAIACRNLAVNAEENHRYYEASKFRYMAMEAGRLEKWRGFAFLTLGWWYWLASGYSERAGRAFLVLLGILVLFAVLYLGLGFPNWETKTTTEKAAVETQSKEPGTWSQLSSALTYSLGVMTLQKPEPRPATNAAQSLVMLETILGPVQAALLALAIRRKFMR
ncbi:MAG TPA: pentapeptide repeat-containing protein [Pyrinomonadaceae bacterium]|nr:pentapeptide repeat-containing protein [Pyrinomonadaceae bacterium]